MDRKLKRIVAVVLAATLLLSLTAAAAAQGGAEGLVEDPVAALAGTPSPQAERADHHRAPDAVRLLALAYLSGRSGQPPAEVLKAIREHGVEAVLKRLGVTPGELRQAVRQLLRIAHHKRDDRPGPGIRDRAEVLTRVLALLSGKTPAEIAQMRRELGSWQAVIEALKAQGIEVTPEAVRAKLRELRGGLRSPLPDGERSDGSAGETAGETGGDSSDGNSGGSSTNTSQDE